MARDSARMRGLVDISGWQVSDEDGHAYTMPDALPAVPPDSYILVIFDGQGATADDYDFSDGVATLHTPAGLLDIFEDEADQVSLYTSSDHSADTIHDFVAWGESPGDDATNAVQAELWRETWWVNLHIGSGVVIEGAETASGRSVGRRPGGTSRAPRDWSIYLEADVSPGAANPLASAYWSTVADGAEMASGGFALGWSWIPDADYQFQMDDDPGFSSPLVDLALSAPRYAPEDPVPPGDYWWRVRATGSSGQSARWSELARVGVSTPESTPHGALQAARQAELDIDPLFQRKDTALLCLDGCDEGDPNDDGEDVAWDSPHPADDIYEHGRKNCVRAAIAMIVTNYSGDLSQDRIAYEEKGGGGPWLDLGHNAGTPGCGPEGSVTRRLLAWALGVNESDILYGQGKPSFGDIRGWLDAGRPVLRLYDTGTSKHAVVIEGYDEWLVPAVRWVRVLDPQAGESEHNYDLFFGFDCYYVPPATAPGVRSDEPGITTDSDGDGIMDFDEETRWNQSHNDLAPDNRDTDEDRVWDKADMREYLFDDSGHAISRHPDVDSDGLFKEIDPDNDDGGSRDGCEDTNSNGRYEPGLGETSNFDPAQEKPCQYESVITDIDFDPPSPATLDYQEPVDITFHYSTNYPGGFRMWVIGYAGGASQPYRGSPLYTGPAAGTAVRGITAFSGPVTIDTVKFLMRSEDRSITLVEFTVPVAYNYVE